VAKSHDKIWPDGVLKPRLDEFLSSRPSVSPVDTVKIGDVEHKVCWRALSREQVEWLKMDGLKHVLTMLDATKVNERYVDSSHGIEAINNENELRMLQASMIDPEIWEDQKKAVNVFSLPKLRATITPDEQDRLHHRWWIWQTHKSEGEITDEQIELLIEESKKKSADPVVLTSLGVGGLLICISTLAEELRNCPTEKSSATGSGDKDSIEPTLDQNLPDNSWQSLFTRLSASLDERIAVALEPRDREIRELRSELNTKKVG